HTEGAIDDERTIPIQVSDKATPTVVEGSRRERTPDETRAEATKPSGFNQRYERGELLGEGGMGEVRIYADRHIGRDVAMKTLRADAPQRPTIRERFLFEARVQGQLEHPSIVPVYDLGVLPDGSEFFTMKRLIG